MKLKTISGESGNLVKTQPDDVTSGIAKALHDEFAFLKFSVSKFENMRGTKKITIYDEKPFRNM